MKSKIGDKKMADIGQIMLYVQFSTVVGGLLVGSFFDLVKREVSDIPWIVMGIEGIITTIIYIIFSTNRSQDGLSIGVNLGAGILIGFLLYYTGVMGGADAKALMALSVNTAIYPFSIRFVTFPIYDIIPSVFNTFFNWLLVMVIIYPIPLLSFNLFKRAKGEKLFEGTFANISDKILIMISGYPISVDKAKNRLDIVYSEIYSEEKKRWEVKNFIQVPELEEEEKYKKEVENKIKDTERKKIWVKVLPPGIVFLLIGYILNVIVGNLLFLLYSFTLP